MLKVLGRTALCLVAGLPALAMASAAFVDVEPDSYQRVIDGKKTDLYTLKNKQGMVVKISNYGDKVVELLVPDRNGQLGDVAMGFNTIEDANKYVPSASSIIGRYANRIANGQFTMDGKPYQLSINNGLNHLHGGTKGTRFRVFDAKQLDDHTL